MKNFGNSKPQRKECNGHFLNLLSLCSQKKINQIKIEEKNIWYFCTGQKLERLALE